MKGLLTTAACAAIAAFALTAFAANANGNRDWRHDMAVSGNDVAAFLHYQPTDGASYAGKVRQALRPSQVNP